jgi:hypothetical protein
MRENPNVVLAWSYSDLHRLYNNEFGEWGGVRFCSSNLVPSFTGQANNYGGATYTAGTGGGGALATGNYTVQIVGQDPQNMYESIILAPSAAVAVTGPTGNISVVVPNTPAGYIWTVYISRVGSTLPVAIATTPTTGIGVPTTGPMAGNATQIVGGSTVVATNLGLSQVPPANPGAGIVVYPTFIFGRGAYAQISLDELKITALLDPDKSDPLNQLRVVGWKVYYGTMITNQQFFMRVESTSNFSATFG